VAFLDDVGAFLDLEAFLGLVAFLDDVDAFLGLVAFLDDGVDAFLVVAFLVVAFLVVAFLVVAFLVVAFHMEDILDLVAFGLVAFDLVACFRKLACSFPFRAFLAFPFAFEHQQILAVLVEDSLVDILVAFGLGAFDLVACFRKLACSFPFRAFLAFPFAFEHQQILIVPVEDSLVEDSLVDILVAL